MNLTQLKLIALEQKVPIISDDALGFLLSVIETHSPTSCLELGTAIGYSSLCIADRFPDLLIDTIEIDKERYNEALYNIAQMRRESQIKVYLGDAIDVVKSLTKTYDFIFIDASKGHYKAFFEVCLPRLSKNGIILFDNMHLKGMVSGNTPVPRRKRTMVKRMREFLLFLDEQGEFEINHFDIGDGVTTLKYKDY